MSLTQRVLQPDRTEFVTVWDPFVRVGHWALVATFAVAYLSAEAEGSGPAALHVWGGYAAGAIVLLRVVWGLVGPRRAQFADFIYRPTTPLQYLADLLRGRARRYLGHSPAGGVMVVALLAALAATVGTGWIAYSGPSQAASQVRISATAHANGTEEDQEHQATRITNGNDQESAVAELHGTVANITLALVIAHVLGVGLASFVHRENLVVAMVTGRKRARDEG